MRNDDNAIADGILSDSAKLRYDNQLDSSVGDPAAYIADQAYSQYINRIIVNMDKR